MPATESQRRAAMNFLQPIPLVLPLADGTIDAQDAFIVVGTYYDEHSQAPGIPIVGQFSSQAAMAGTFTSTGLLGGGFRNLEG